MKKADLQEIIFINTIVSVINWIIIINIKQAYWRDTQYERNYTEINFKINK